MISRKLLRLALLIATLAIIIFNTNVISVFYTNYFVAESSVWCVKSFGQTSSCKFKNVCYDPQLKTLLFFLNNKTVIKGISHYKDLQKIQLSSVHSHNQFYANLSVIDVTKYQNKKEIFQYQKVFLFSRFKPDNLMHSIHDDLFPLFLSLESACLGEIECMEKYHLVMFDHYPKGPYFELYQLFSHHPLVVLNELMSETNLLCFNEMLTGLNQDSIFFQYGFTEPLSPIKTSLLDVNDIYRFTLYIKSKLGISKSDNKSLEVVLLSRTKNRKILNVNKLEEWIKSGYQKLEKKVEFKIVHLDSSVKATDLIKLISNVDLMIGMHGAEMILGLFMKPNSIIFELFPFGIQPSLVSFIRAVAEVENSELAYFSWRNMYRNHSVAHENSHPLFGGISHLSKSMQEKIKSMMEVPPTKCCNDPLYLYYMYQDTNVSSEFRDFFYRSLLEFYTHQKRSVPNKILKKWFYPHKIINISCKFNLQKRELNISWDPPFNVNSNNLEYRLYVKDEVGKYETEFSTKQFSVLLPVPDDIFPKFQVWISVHCDFNDSDSPDLYVECF